MTNPMLPRPFRVHARRRETSDTFTLVLEPADGGPVPGFAPGQFHMLTAHGAGEAAISISGDPADDRTVVHTIRAVGTVTRALQRLRRGDVLGLRGPYGKGWDLESASGGDVVIVAGGIGLAPLRPALHQLAAERARYGSVIACIGARTPEDRLYATQMERWAERGILDVRSTVDHAGPDWTGRVGVVTDLLSRARFDPARTTALVCGPEIMMRVAASALRRTGVPESRIRVSMERNMRCAIGQCGHCQFGPHILCTDGPVFPLSEVARWMEVAQL
ncbi:MAG: FAD/NAD(P)-binding protein [Armatimonadota bacterium]